jgi:hypothetical protein
MMMTRPAPTEYHEYFSRYIDLVHETDILPVLHAQIADMQGVLQRAAGKEQFAYAPGKWTIRQVIGHVSDTERVFGYRALVFARGDAAELPGFDENAYAEQSPAAGVSLSTLVDEFVAVRRSHIHLLAALDDALWARSGVANNRTITVRALAYLMAGHVRHHLNGLTRNYGV